MFVVILLSAALAPVGLLYWWARKKLNSETFRHFYGASFRYLNEGSILFFLSGALAGLWWLYVVESELFITALTAWVLAGPAMFGAYYGARLVRATWCEEARQRLTDRNGLSTDCDHGDRLLAMEGNIRSHPVRIETDTGRRSTHTRILCPLDDKWSDLSVIPRHSPHFRDAEGVEIAGGRFRVYGSRAAGAGRRLRETGCDQLLSALTAAFDEVRIEDKRLIANCRGLQIYRDEFDDRLRSVLDAAAELQRDVAGPAAEERHRD